MSGPASRSRSRSTPIRTCEWHGVVESVSPAAAQEFSLLPAQNTSGNWVKVVQRVPMRVRIDTSDKNLPPLRAGMSVVVDVDTGHARGFPHFLTGCSAVTRRRVMARRTAPSGRQSRRDHRLRHPGDADAGARHDDRQRRAALHAGQRFGEPGSDRLGADLLHRRGRDHDAADRLSGQPVRAEAPFSGRYRRLHRGLDAVRHGAVAEPDRAVSHLAGRVRRLACSAFADRAVRELPAGAPGLCHGPVRHWRDDRPGPWSGARRLAYRELQLALCLLYQLADRHSRPHRHYHLPAGDIAERRARSSIGSASAL